MILQSFRPGAGVAPVTVTLRSSLGLRVLSPKTISSNGVPPVQTCKQSGSGPRSLSRSAGRLKRFVALGQATDSQSSEPSIQPSSVWEQKIITLPAYNRGCHVVTRKLLEQLPELLEFEVGMANLFIQHTSASLTINENASPDVPKDLNDSLDKIVPEGNWYRHLDEGMDDMPAHVKVCWIALGARGKGQIPGNLLPPPSRFSFVEPGISHADQRFPVWRRAGTELPDGPKP